MKTNRSIIIGSLAVALAAATAGAFYYRTRAAQLERQWKEAMNLLAAIGQTPPAKITALQAAAAPADRPETIRQLAELEAALKEKELLIARLKAERPRGPAPETERTSRFQALKETDPEKYEELQARREEFRRRVQASFADRAVRLLERDTDKMSEEEREEYETLLHTLNETWQLAEKLMSDLPRDEKRELQRELFQKNRELQPMLQSEREKTFYELGQSLGCSDAEAEQFVDYLNETINMTSPQSLMRIGRRGRIPER